MADIQLLLRRGYGYFRYSGVEIPHEGGDTSVSGLVRFSQRSLGQQRMLNNGDGLAVIYAPEPEDGT